MSEIVPREMIEKLEQRHEVLIEELDALNERLEKALNSFVKPSVGNDEIRLTNDKRMTKSEA